MSGWKKENQKRGVVFVTYSRKRVFFAMLFSLALLLSGTEPVNALSNKNMRNFAQNNILFYDPDEGTGSKYCLSSGSGNSASSKTGSDKSIPTEVTGTGAERVKSAAKVYGEVAMQMQRTYGVPWEVLIAQMQIESQVGTSDLGINANNWLGITGTGDAGKYGRFAKFSNVEASIQAWAGPKVMRNGMYDAAFQYLDPNNWDFHRYLQTMISVYAPASDGNDEAGYVANIEAIIEKMVKPVREEMGWLSSEELAKQEKIEIGGKYPLGTEVGDEIVAMAECSSPAASGDINATALLLSWPDQSHAPTDPKPEYREALASTGVNQLGDSCSMGGNSCDAFVATVMRFSGADPEFPCCGVVNQIPYLEGHPEMYQEIENIGSAENMLPGDIRIRSSHIEMYVVEDGVGKIASASHCDRTGDRASSYYVDMSYRIFRRI